MVHYTHGVIYRLSVCSGITPKMLQLDLEKLPMTIQGIPITGAVFDVQTPKS